MEKEITKLRTQLANCERNGQGRRKIGASLRAEAGELSRAWRQTGGSVSELARRLGVSGNMVARWGERARVAGSRVRRVEVEAPARAEGLVLVLASGHRIEGLTVADVVEIATALS